MENSKFVTVRDVIINETIYLKTRPEMRLEGDFGNLENKTDASDIQSKSVKLNEISHKSDNDKSDIFVGRRH